MDYDLGEVESDLIGKIYTAALDSSGWCAVLQSLAEICGADQCDIFFYDAKCRARNFVMAAKTRDGILDKFMLEFIDMEVAAFQRQLIALKEGQVVASDDIVKMSGKTYDQIVGDEFVETFFPKMQFNAGVILLRDSMMCCLLGLRNFCDTPLLNKSAQEFLVRLTPHMIQAMKIHNYLSDLGQVNQAIKVVLERIKHGIFLLDDSMRVIFSNTAAVRLLESGSTVDIGRFGRLCLANAAENQQLQTLMQRLACPLPAGGDRCLEMAVTSAVEFDRPLKLTVSRIDVNSDHELHREGIAIAVYIGDPNRPGHLANDYMKQAYALTATECSIMAALLNNKNFNEIAQIRGTTLETTRSQFKSILQKTGTHSQAELSRLMLALEQDYL